MIPRRSSIALGVLSGLWATVLVGLLPAEGDNKADKKEKDSGAAVGQSKEGAEAQKKYPEPDPSKGVLEGVIFFEGEMPEIKPIKDRIASNHQDRAACIEHVKNEELILSADKAVKNAVVSVGDYKPSEKVNPREITLDNNHCTFVPHAQATTVGSTLIVTNSDSFLHNTHALLTTQFNNAIQKGDKLEKKLQKPGRIYVTCDFHTWMTANIWVFPHDLFDVSGDHGTYRIVNIPPGEHEMVFTHEILVEHKEKVKIEAGKTTKLDVKLKAWKKPTPAATGQSSSQK